MSTHGRPIRYAVHYNTMTMPLASNLVGPASCGSFMGFAGILTYANNVYFCPLWQSFSHRTSTSTLVHEAIHDLIINHRNNSLGIFFQAVYSPWEVKARGAVVGSYVTRLLRETKVRGEVVQSHQMQTAQRTITLDGLTNPYHCRECAQL